jgi:hypothetical protein
MTHGGASPAKHGAVAVSGSDGPRVLAGQGTHALAVPARRLAVRLRAQGGRPNGKSSHCTESQLVTR